MQLASSLLFGVSKQEVGLRRMREFWAGLPIGLLAGLFIWLAPAVGGTQSQPLGGQTALVEASASFLPVDEAFSLEYGWVSADVLRVRWVIAQGYYLYRDQIVVQGEDWEIPALPPGEQKVDEFFGETQVYHESLDLLLTLKAGEAGKVLGAPKAEASEAEGRLRAFPLMLRWQGCAEAGLCYLPQMRSLEFFAGSDEVVLALPQPELAEDEQLAQRLAQAGVLLNLVLFFGLGLLLAFTPCVLPMVPILSGLLVGAGQVGRYQHFVLSASYVLAMASTYAVIGVLAAVTGVSLQAVLQQPAVLIAFSALMAAMALAMFGVYELRLPAFVTQWVVQRSNAMPGGQVLGAAGMGGLSALIAGPCVAPPLVGVLLYIGHQGDLLLGGLALFAVGLGMGLPLLVFGTVLGGVLPKAGGWMTWIQRLMGFALLGLGIWFLDRIFSQVVVDVLWALLLAAVAGWVLTADAQGGYGHVAGQGQPVPAASGYWSWRRAPRLLIATAGVCAALWFLAAAVGIHLPGHQSAGEDWQADVSVDSELALERALEQHPGPYMLDFYADWCIECQILEKQVFATGQVRTAMRRWTTIRVDVTQGDSASRALLQRYDVVGPPTLIFLDAQGVELRSARLIGGQSVEAVLGSLRHAPDG